MVAYGRDRRREGHLLERRVAAAGGARDLGEPVGEGGLPDGAARQGAAVPAAGRAQARREGDLRDAGGALQDAGADRLDAVRQREGRERRAAAEGMVAYGLDAVGQGDGRERRAAAEGMVAYGRDNAAIDGRRDRD